MHSQRRLLFDMETAVDFKIGKFWNRIFTSKEIQHNSYFWEVLWFCHFRGQIFPSSFIEKNLMLMIQEQVKKFHGLE